MGADAGATTAKVEQRAILSAIDARDANALERLCRCDHAHVLYVLDAAMRGLDRGIRPSAAEALLAQSPDERARLDWLLERNETLRTRLGPLQRDGDLAVLRAAQGWRATFLHRSHVNHPWAGQVLWYPTLSRAVQQSAWHALNTPFAKDRSVV